MDFKQPGASCIADGRPYLDDHSGKPLYCVDGRLGENEVVVDADTPRPFASAAGLEILNLADDLASPGPLTSADQAKIRDLAKVHSFGGEKPADVKALPAFLIGALMLLVGVIGGAVWEPPLPSDNALSRQPETPDTRMHRYWSPD